MTAILYPVAANAEQAMAGPLGRAAREREAAGVAGEAVVFTTDPAGPAFATREAAVEAYARAGGRARGARLAEQILPGQKLAPRQAGLRGRPPLAGADRRRRRARPGG